MGRVTVLSLAACCLLSFIQAQSCPGNLRCQERGIVVRQDTAAKNQFYVCMIGGVWNVCEELTVQKNFEVDAFLNNCPHQFSASFYLPGTSFTHYHLEGDLKQALQCFCYLPFLLQCGPATKICWNTVVLNAWLLTEAQGSVSKHLLTTSDPYGFGECICLLGSSETRNVANEGKSKGNSSYSKLNHKLVIHIQS